VGAERHEDIEGRRRLSDLPVKRLKQKSHGSGPGAVRDDEQDLSFAIILGGARLRYKVADLRVSERTGQRSLGEKSHCIESVVSNRVTQESAIDPYVRAGGEAAGFGTGQVNGCPD